MTCIVAIKNNDGKIYMGGDSAGVAGHNIHPRSDEKVFINGPMLFGFTDSFRMGQILRFSFDIPPHPEGKEDLEYLCTDFVESIYGVFEYKGYGKIEANRKKGGQFMIGYKGEIYIVYSDYQVGLHGRNYDAIGSGAEVALGALYTMNNMTFLPENKVKYALDAAANHISSVRAPYTILSI